MRTDQSSVPQEMHAVTIDRFGGPEVVHYGPRPVPEVGPGQVLIAVSHAGVGSWDPWQRDGFLAEVTGVVPEFPLTLGGDGSGTVVAVGAGVDRFRVGQAVYAVGEGFYAEYVAVDADGVAPLPDGVDLAAAGAMPIVALTAVRGLVAELQVSAGDTVLITGASGDVGHLAVQLAHRLGARVLAVASGEDGASLARNRGAAAAVDGRTVDVAAAARAFAPDGIDAVLSLVGGPVQDTAASTLRTGGRLAYPLGVTPEPAPRDDVDVRGFDLTVDGPASLRPWLAELNALVAAGPFTVRIAQAFPLAEAAAAQEALPQHRLGKIVLQVRG